MKKYISILIILIFMIIGLYVSNNTIELYQELPDPNSLAGKVYSDIHSSNLGIIETSKVEMFDSCTIESRQTIEAWLIFRTVFDKHRYEISQLPKLELLLQIKAFTHLIDEIHPRQMLYIQILVEELIAYKTKIDGVENNKEIFDQALTLKRTKKIMTHLYKNGLEKTNQECLTNNKFIKGFNQVDQDSLSYSDTSFETWAYTFWLRRHDENIEDQTYAVLNIVNELINRISTDKPKKSVFWHVSETSSQYHIQPNNSVLEEFYNQIIVGRKLNRINADNILKIWVESLSYGPETLPFYKFRPFMEKELLSLTSINKGERGPIPMPFVPFYTYQSTDRIDNDYNFFTNNIDVKINNQMEVVDISSGNKKQVQEYLGNHYQIDWYLKGKDGKDVACPREYQIRQIKGKTQEYFLVERECFIKNDKQYLDGMSSTIVLENRSLENTQFQLVEIHSSLHIDKRVVILSDFIADVDNDGFLEVITNTSVDRERSEDELVELDRGSFQLFRRLTEYFNGKIITIGELKLNRELMLERLEFIESMDAYEEHEQYQILSQDYSGGIYYSENSNTDSETEDYETYDSDFKIYLDAVIEKIKNIFGFNDDRRDYIHSF